MSNTSTNGHTSVAPGDPTDPATTPDPAHNTLNLWQKLTAIGREGGTIKKTGNNGHFNYKFIEHSEIMGVFRPLLDKYGVAIDCEITDHSRNGDITTLKFIFKVTNADNPLDEYFSRLWFSEARDSQDKGINKALTAAEKNFFMKLFHISDADPDADETEEAKPPRPAATPKPASPPAPALAPITTGSGGRMQKASELFNAKPVAVVAPLPVATNDPTPDDIARVFEVKIRVAMHIRDLNNIITEINRELPATDRDNKPIEENQAIRAALREMWNARKEELLEPK
jgi:ERF superfamily